MEQARRKTPLIAKIGLGAVFAVVAIPVLWAIFYFVIYIGYGNWQVRGHQEFARSGVSQIQPAAEMEDLFEDCRHYIVYAGHGQVSTWNTTAYFGDRYTLTMQVPVDIRSKDSGSMIGDPKFYLHEVESVDISPSGQVGASFSADFKFDAAQWKKVYESGGDFSSIGFTIKKSSVTNFKKYADAGRPSN
jgi:hypothetical protein